ncbi:wax ester/triacylglycerol synthase domain-containing protein [Gordonia liuliyuniae]|uniref:Diacylglycerol O-acyltransferase n=1 Tax=Gordonia liuliyuniae TaxID=2911517 RepID=A0ABS9IMX6_9ACTN|nr:wax ester/triacylglycerol synthase domain-containing protein [Gordonia liuliyuniae]MCF8586899.1 diacylglycerol O-acyltransferase [Gordonia liuliyuniae]
MTAAAEPSVAEFGPSDFTYLHSDGPGAPAHWGMLLTLAGGEPLTLDAVRQRVADRVGRYELFHVGVRGGRDEAPEIVVADVVDVPAHVTEVHFDGDVAVPVATLLEQPLPQPRPYWHLTLLTSPDTQHVLLKVHHSLSDGIAGAAFSALLADGSDDDLASFDRFATSPRFRVGDPDEDVLATARAAFEKQWMDGAEGRAWPTLTGHGRRETAVFSASTRALRRAARAHDASVHEFLIAAIGRAVSIAPPASDGPQSSNIRVTLPVTLDPAFRHTGNAVAVSLLNLPGDDADLASQIAHARSELALIDEGRLGLALAAVDGAPPIEWSDMRTIVAESMKRMSPDIHIGINPGFTRVHAVLGRDIAELTALSPLIGYSFSVTGLILGTRTTLGIVADPDALPGYPARFVEVLTEVIASASA